VDLRQRDQGLRDLDGLAAHDEGQRRLGVVLVGQVVESCLQEPGALAQQAFGLLVVLSSVHADPDPFAQLRLRIDPGERALESLPSDSDVLASRIVSRDDRAMGDVPITGSALGHDLPDAMERAVEQACRAADAEGIPRPRSWRCVALEAIELGKPSTFFVRATSD
jgi:hypothetical protein